MVRNKELGKPGQLTSVLGTSNAARPFKCGTAATVVAGRSARTGNPLNGAEEARVTATQLFVRHTAQAYASGQVSSSRTGAASTQGIIACAVHGSGMSASLSGVIRQVGGPEGHSVGNAGM